MFTAINSFSLLLILLAEVPDASVHLLGSLLLRHMAQLITNAHAVTELLEDEEAGSVEQVRLASHWSILVT